MRKGLARAGWLAFLIGAVGGCAAAPAPSPRALAVELLGSLSLPSEEIDGALLGGLSGLAWEGEDRFLAISDDKAEHGPARFYRLWVGVEKPPGLAVAVEGWTALRLAAGITLPAPGADCEGIAASPRGEIWISSEGWVERGVSPWIAAFAASGALLRELPLPAGIAPAADGKEGVRNNLALEGLAVTADGRYLFVGIEGPLVQDGEANGQDRSAPSRLLRYDLDEGRWDGAFAYPLDPPHAAPAAGDHRIGGLVAVEALDRDHLLALERSAVSGHGVAARIYRVSLAGAEALAAEARLSERPVPVSARKELLVDLGTLGVPMGNFEGLALGRELPGGRRLLLVVSDDNFSDGQETILLALALSREALAPSR